MLACEGCVLIMRREIGWAGCPSSGLLWWSVVASIYVPTKG